MGVYQDDLNDIAEDALKQGLLQVSFLVTGATGLIGTTLVRGLLAANERGADIKVYVLVRNEEKAKYLYEELLSDHHLQLVVSDINEAVPLQEHVDYIIHAANETKSKSMVEKPVETLWTGVNGTHNVLEFARKTGVFGIVYLSSMEAFGATDPSLKDVREEDLGTVDLTKVRSCYPESKRLNENMCACYAAEYQVPVCIARLAQTFGAGVSPDDTRVFAQFARSAIQSKNIILHTEGKSVGNYVYLADAIRAILVLLVRGKAGEAYTVANPQNAMTIREMAEMVAREIAHDAIQVTLDIPQGQSFGYAQDTTMHLNADKMMALGWRPQYSLKEMYERMIEDWKREG